MSIFRTDRPTHKALFALVALSLASCGDARKPAAEAPRPALAAGVERWLPLVDRTVFAYDTVSEPSGDKGMLVLEIRRPGSTLAELVVAGHAQRVEVDATGIRHASGGYLLKEPLEVGAKFRGDFGEVEVTSVTREAKVPAGNFTGCLETVESVAQAAYSKRTTTVFCPGVGITLRRTEAESDDGSGAESMKLKSHGPKFEAFK
jgi:hypothetical protein